MAIGILTCGLTCAHLFLAQTIGRDRIPQRIERSRRALVQGNRHPLARKEYDAGKVGNSFPMERITLTLKSTDAQEAALSELLKEQQDPASANYQHWLSPEEFADLFGLSGSDMERLASWLRSEGFTIADIARGRRSISFTGTAGQVEAAFGTETHGYLLNNEFYYANASEPSVPEDIRNVVLGFRNLNSFRLKARVKTRKVIPDFTSNVTGNHFIAPDDYATIYDIQPLYAEGIDGTGQAIAIAGQTNIITSDIRAFRTASGLSATTPQVILVPGSRNPGINDNDLQEADLDLEWSGAVARNAGLIYVNSNNGALDSLQYAIDQNLAPVVSVSYGNCEPNWNAAERNSLLAITQEANAQGITVVAAAGDAGAADCDSGVSSTSLGLSVDLPAGLPSVTGIGGTEFNELGKSWSSTNQSFGNASGKPQPTYWAGTNNSGNGSALSYIPEIAWNDTFIAGELLAGGGGRSVYYTKPSWQTGLGVPNDNARDVPDISLAASPETDGYLTCSNNSCANGFRYTDNSLNVVGGTSAGAPGFAGMTALINQKTNHSQGNTNPTLYRLAATTPSAFHDILVGGNQVPCNTGTKDCVGGVLGYAATAGFDLATGLGSVDVFKLITAWQ